jgi:Tfp pilus assembly protein PilO
MKLSEREIVLFWATGVAALVGLSYVVAAPKVRDWGALRAAHSEAQRKITAAERMVAQRPQWHKRLEDLRGKLPQYAPEKDVTADLLIRIDELAKRSGLVLPSREVDKEVQQGDLFDLAVNCKWEGKLDAIVQFLFELQNQDVILDASQLTIAPNERKVPRGSFTVNCTYARAGKAGTPATARPPEPKN